MPRSESASLEALIREVRRAFNALRGTSDALHGHLGITAAMRAVMEQLSQSGARTVPGLAREKNVTRQHIQQVMNALIEARLVRAAANPRHQNSPLIALTPSGTRTFARIRRREAVALAELAERFSAQELEQATTMLRALSATLESVERTSDRRSA